MGNRKNDALVPGIAAPGTYMEMNERQYPGMGSCRNLFKTGEYLALTLSQEMNIQQPYKRC